ncbi:T9SS type A sorting domain-containing protein [Polaribacter sp. L3A8]|uniref:T9SS type A sorting domain-containing protein n=1 Tax=Polaribacter sp. L3A8 TaxID=2686361 RepID=UPI00131EC8C9|nr:T9SS type A sorting domain-containing protein [Polaribacter sp. L3A8]
MKKTITFLLLLYSTALIHGQINVNDFELGYEPVVISTNFNTNVVVNPTKAGLNLSENCLQVGRTAAVEWWRSFIINVNPNLVIAPSEKKFLSVMVNYPASPDFGVSTAGADDTDRGLNSLITRSLNTYDASVGKVNTWQELVFEIKTAGTGAHTFTNGTMYKVVFYPDMGFNNVPAGRVLTNPTIGYVDNIRVLDYNPLDNNWLGTTSTDWNTSTNWSKEAVPVTTDNVVIPSGTTFSPEISSHTGVTVDDLTVASGAILTIKDGSSLIVSGAATGNITYKRTLSKAAGLTEGWHSLSSPVLGVTASSLRAENDFADGSGGNRIGLSTYNNVTPAWNYFTTTSTDAIPAGTGLSVKLDNGGSNTEVSFTGTYSGAYTEVVISQGSNNFNYVGNPFLSYHNLGGFFTGNAQADRLSEPTIWFWDENKEGVNMGGYVTKMSGIPLDTDFELAPGQGFFVSAGSAASNKVAFFLGQLSHQGTDSFLKSVNNTTEIKLKVTQDNSIHSTKLYYIEGTSTGFDNGFDGSLFGGVEYDLSIYTGLINEDKKLSVQSLPNSDYDAMVVPIGIKSSFGKEITISASSLNLPDGINVYLEDRLNNTFTNLNEGNFKVTLKESIDGTGRFFLKTTANVLSTVSTELAGVQVFKKMNNMLTIKGLQPGKATISIFNTLGKQVMNSNFTSNNNIEIALPILASGIYFVKLETESGRLNKKIILE